MSGYQQGMCQTPKGSNFFQFVSFDSGFTSAVSPSIASSNSVRRSSRFCHHIREARPCDKPLFVAAPAVDHWSRGMWVGSKMVELQSLCWHGTEGRKAVFPGCEENNKTTNWSLGQPAHVCGAVTLSIQISTEFWDMKLIICLLLYCYISPHS
jgi:hypothetical protein